MKIAMVQMNPLVGDFDGNTLKISENIKKAEALGADVIVFPEMCICGYPPLDLLEYPRFAAENLKSLREIQKSVIGNAAVIVGYVDRNPQGTGKPLQNAAAVLYRGKLYFRQAKTLLPTYDVFDEDRYFEPADRRSVFSLFGKKIGIAICEDLWWETEPVPGAKYAVDPVRELLDEGAEIIIAPSASPYHSGKSLIRRQIADSLCSSSGVPLVYVNMVGATDNLVFDGNSFFCDGDGTVTASLPFFAETLYLLDTDKPAGQIHTEEKYENMLHALELGVRDYLHKCGFKKAHLGLSGGVDSALVCVIAARALGKENVRVFLMPSRYSSEGSLSDSVKLAGNLGIGYEIIPIEDCFKALLETMGPVFKGKEQDVTEENMQARLRGIILMSYSNKFASLLLTTGNKSEMATGYCTLYGDMCGGLSVIGDVLKTEVYEMCRFINKDREIIPENILTKPPSAELRPDQKDQDSLPPYDVLDRIIYLHVVKNKSLEEICAEGIDRETARRILRLIALNEYKRWQAPPVLKVSPKAFGSGRRIPIARKFYEIKDIQPEIG
ncbi:MAG: NAD+ synthase [Spirochaetales bacterium]|nr:NAD+ synthase [Spirochaetales bacterium]